MSYNRKSLTGVRRAAKSFQPSPMSFAAKRKLLPCTALILCLSLAGCGFQPLNSRNVSNGDGSNGQAGQTSTLDEMAAIRIAPLSDRAGQEMHNFLRDRLNPSGQPSAPRYELQIRLTESIRELAFESDETATRADLSIVASYWLRQSDSQKILSAGQSRSISSYNILERQFASTVSEADARTRTLRDIADDIRIRLGAYFTSARVSSQSPGS